MEIGKFDYNLEASYSGGDVPSHRVGSVKRRRQESNKPSKRIRIYDHVFEYGDKCSNNVIEE